MISEPKAVLIIDDDSRNIFALSAVLRSRGYTCLSAMTISDAEKLIKSNAGIGIILIDMMMPDMDGYQAIPYLKNLVEGEQLPIISVTAQAMVGDREKCLQAGADGYIAKPVDVDSLITILKQYIG